jgi:lipopolysaccharide heptosyltransferase I
VTSILILRLSALGDVIHTIPAVAALRAARPDARLLWVVEAAYRELVEIVAGVETVPVRMKKWGKAPWASRNEIRTALRAMRTVDESIDFQGLIKSAALARLSGAKVRYGFEQSAIREKPAAWAVNRPVAVDQTSHVVDWNLQLARGANGTHGTDGTNERTSPSIGPISPIGPIVSPNHAAPPGTILHNSFTAFAHDPQNKLSAYRDAIVLLPGAGKPNKLWPVERFRELAVRLGKEQVVAAWGPSEQHLAHAIGANVAPPTTLRELAFLLKHARLVIGGDTGPLHLADALGTPVIGLYGPTNPRRNGPFYQPANVIEKFSSTKSMESITVEEVMTLRERVRPA